MLAASQLFLPAFHKFSSFLFRRLKVGFIRLIDCRQGTYVCSEQLNPPPPPPPFPSTGTYLHS